MKRILVILSVLLLLSACDGLGLRDLPDLENPEISISDIVITNEENGVVTQTSMISSSPTIYVYLTIENAADSTVSAEWFYEIDTIIDTLDVSITENAQRFVLSITSPYGGWPEGDYSIDVYKDTEFIDTVTYEISDPTPLSNPSFMVGEYTYNHADGTVPVNIVRHMFTLHSDGTWTESYLWASLTQNSTAEGTDNGTWTYANNELQLLTDRGYNRTLQVEGQSIVGVNIVWNDVTLYFSKPWIND